jgi:NAD(P)-dependent dehydrogenase (short-subunit alcohol dehydrogenase family)
MFRKDLLEDKVVLVTGGGSGLGRSMAERFLQLGAKVAIASRRIELLESVANQLEQETGGQVYATQVDVRRPEQVASMIDNVEAHFGPIDVLVNNAAGNFISPTERLSHRAFDAVMGIVLHGSVYCTLELGKRWIDRDQAGTVLSIVATYATTGSGYVVPSAISKAGVVTLTKSLAGEWGKYGIRLNAIAPGPFPTEGAWSRLMPTEAIETLFASQIPLGRMGEHQELANLACYLISDEAAFVTGALVHIDGGESSWNAGGFNVLDRVTTAQWDELEAVRKGSKD